MPPHPLDLSTNATLPSRLSPTVSSQTSLSHLNSPPTKPLLSSPAGPNRQRNPRKTRPSPYTSPLPATNHVPLHTAAEPHPIPPPPPSELPTPNPSPTHRSAAVWAKPSGGRREIRRCGPILGSGRWSAARFSQPGRGRAFLVCRLPPGLVGAELAGPMACLGGSRSVMEEMRGDDADTWVWGVML